MKPTTTFLTALLVALACASCSKDSDGNGHFDPTKFYIAGTTEGASTDSTGYALLFQPNGVGAAVSARKNANASYEFQNGHLKFIFKNSSEGFDFTIHDNKITGASELSHTMGLPHTYSLQKIPGTDGFKGKTFAGQADNTGITVKFGTDGNLEVSQTQNALTITQKGKYTLQNNAVANANVVNIDPLLCILLDGKLIISSSDATGSIENYAVLEQAK
jgi:hypothetical protein